MDSLPAQLTNTIYVNIASYLRTDDVAIFSMVCKDIRRSTMELTSIDLTQIAYCYSKLQLLNIIKILRFHPFIEWVIPTASILIQDLQLSTTITNCLQNKYKYPFEAEYPCTNHHVQRIVFKRVAKIDDTICWYRWKANDWWRDPFAGQSLNSLKVDDRRVRIPIESFRASFKSLQCLQLAPSNINMDSINELSNFVNLKTLSLRTFGPRARTRVFDWKQFKLCQFDKLKQLILSGQWIKFPLNFLLKKITTFPVLETCRIEYCHFGFHTEDRDSSIICGRSQLESYVITKTQLI
eukprot:215585_1